MTSTSTTFVTPSAAKETKKNRKKRSDYLGENHYKEMRRKIGKNYRTMNPEKHLYWLAKSRAKRKNVDFNLTPKDIVIPERCPYLGILLKPTTKRGESRNQTCSLDRIDNTKGYVRGNVEVISWQANTMKNNATPEQLVSFAWEILKRNQLTT